MSKQLVTIVGLALGTLLTLSSAALAHPSENRADQSTFGGPHCHINLISGSYAYPSHRGHMASGLSDGVFAATSCPE
jgi:hypothetical protein